MAYHEVVLNETFTPRSVLIAAHYSQSSTLNMRLYEPYSWAQEVKWDLILQSLVSSQQLVRWRRPSRPQLEAVYHPTDQTFMALPDRNESTILFFHLMATLLNNMARSEQNNDDTLAQMEVRLVPIALQSLEALAAALLEALGERFFAAAVMAGDGNTVLAMLRMNINPGVKLRIGWPSQSTPVYPLQYAISRGHFLVAKIIVLHLCKSATPSFLNRLLRDIISYGKISIDPRQRHRKGEFIELLCIVLSAGASPTRGCVVAAANRFDLIRQLNENGTKNIRAWIRVGLLENCFISGTYMNDFSITNRGSLVNDILRYVFHRHLHQLPLGDMEFRVELLNVLCSAILTRHRSAVETIVHAFGSLGYHFDNDSNNKGVIGGLIVDACNIDDWYLATSLISAILPKVNQHEPIRFAGLSKEQVEELEQELHQAIYRDNIQRVCGLLKDHAFLGWQDAISLAIRLGHYRMAVTIIRHMEDLSRGGYSGLAILIEHGRTAAIVELLREMPGLRGAMESADQGGDFGALINMADQCSSGILKPPPNLKYLDGLIRHRQVLFRVIAYHTFATNNFDLFRWLLQFGMDVDELVYCEESPSFKHWVGFLKRPTIYGTSTFDGDQIGKHLNRCSIRVWPSLLAIAAQHNLQHWIEFLLSEGASCRDSMALCWAVAHKVQIATIRLLLQAANDEKSRCKYTYGSAALREAVRQRNLDMIDVLADTVDVDCVESSTVDLMEYKRPLISPMGEAIIRDDIEMVRKLLEKGASSNACVAYDGLDSKKHVKSWIPRVTPLLAAIDMENLPMIMMLAGSGAEIDYSRQTCVTRTPLQRASEIGNFEIVRYLVGQKALIDTTPAYSSGTALQLAAMNGYVGIATFLLEHFADPNHPPAGGDGRTAFEAAAEWARIDMVSLLIQARVQLDMEVGDPPESQYKRALRFAENNGYPASKRYVQHLYEKTAEWSRSEAQTLGLVPSPTFGMFPFEIPSSPW